MARSKSGSIIKKKINKRIFFSFLGIMTFWEKILNTLSLIFSLFKKMIVPLIKTQELRT